MKLPIGIQSFQKIREKEYYYVDKTTFIHDLIENGSYYFLSRPRRFGKSLLVDTMQELFEGNELIFKGLYIYDEWDWSKKYPVIKISFGGGVLKSREELDFRIHKIIEENVSRLNVEIDSENDISGKFRELIRNTEKLHGQRVAILVDEYDKPILDNIENHDVALEMREGLKNFYSPIKEADAHVKFVFLTGVSKFSKVSLFSGLNNLTDITLDQRYSAICGYTEQDLETVFKDPVSKFDRTEVRKWYNGYNWLGEPVYNPFDLLLLFDKGRMSPYWFETGTPTFLIKLLKERTTWLPGLNDIFATEKLLSTFDVDHVPTEALMFQAGYLTIKDFQEMPGRLEVQLSYPNKEVETALNDSLLLALTSESSGYQKNVSLAHKAMIGGDLKKLEHVLKAFYASIPCQWYVKNNIAEYEGYYASVFYAIFASSGLDVTCEESSNRGRLDMAVKYQDKVYLFEFKILENHSTGSALRQIKEQRYEDKYKNERNEIFLIGIEFNAEERNIQHFDWEKVE